MGTSNSGGERWKIQARKIALQFDKELEEHYETVESDVFDRKTRNAALESGEFIPPSGTLFEAIFQELKRKEAREKNGHPLSSMISRFRIGSKK